MAELLPLLRTLMHVRRGDLDPLERRGKSKGDYRTSATPRLTLRAFASRTIEVRL